MAAALLFGVGALLSAVMLVIAVRSWRYERRSLHLGNRLAAYGGRRRPIAVQPGPGVGSVSLALSTRQSEADVRLARWLPGAARLRDVLDRTGKSISLGRYARWTTFVVIAVFTAAALALHGNFVIALGLAGAAGYFLPRLVVGQMAKRRLAAFIRQFPDAIDLIVRALRAGLPLSEALITISQECADPVGAEFRKVVGALAISRSVEDALWQIERTIDSAELRFFIISISTQIQTGGNLGETLGNLANILRQRSQMRMKVKAMTGEARASAGVLGSLPFVIGLLMSFTNPTYIAPLFSDPRGWVMLGGGAIMLTIGVGIMAKLVSFEI